ncbi:MAG TPA: PxKF domain-containing protein [Candidatus Limnocylindria bacterium]|nr:PxKF domain-containing protein [Candidatus Limnocylindria bacterium]
MFRKRFYRALAVFTVGTLVLATATFASDVDVSVVDVTVPTTSVTLAPGGSGSITINMSVTGNQVGTATFEVNRDWVLSGGTFTGSNPQEFTVPPRGGGDPATTFTTTGTVSVASAHGPGTFALAVGAFDITNSNATGAKLGAGDSSNYQVTVSAPTNTAPTTPGVPTLTVGSSPNQGVFTLGWTASSDDGLPPGSGVTYTLQHRDSDDALFSNVATGLTSNSFAFATLSPEAEGTWTYRVSASDGTLTSAFSGASSAVKVDQSAPNAPTLTPDRSPEDSVGGWYKNTVTISFTDNGDPALIDNSSGSGVDASTVPAPVTKNTSGTHTVTGTVFDNVGLESDEGSLTVLVDATVPDVAFTDCPTTSLVLGTAATANWTASDAHSGLATPSSGSEALDTSTIGSRSVTANASDNVGLANSATCAYSVIYDFDGFFRPVDNLPALNVTKAGSAVPIKFSLNGDQGLNILAAGSPTSKVSTCDVAGAPDTIEETVTAGQSSLSYDALADQYVYVWKTDKSWAGTCRTLTVKLADGTVHQALFKLTK